MTVEFGFNTPYGGGWEALKTFALTAERVGIDHLWTEDHLTPIGGERGPYEAWTVMSMLAGATSRIRLGHQVLCQSFRNPGLLAKMATTFDLVSGGRLRLLLGAGWLEDEYEQFGYPFPAPGQRLAELEDTVRICRGLFDGEGEPFTYRGAHHHVDAARNLPAPTRRIPLGVGGTGDRMLDLVARLADEWNTPAVVLPRYEERATYLDERLAAHGREVRRSTQIVFSPGDRATPRWLEMFRPDLGVRGSRDQMVQRVGELADLGVEGFYGFVADDEALDGLAEVLPDLRAAV